MLEVSAVRLHACTTKTLAPQMMLDRRHATLAAHTLSVRQCRAPTTGTLAVGRRSRSRN